MISDRNSILLVIGCCFAVSLSGPASGQEVVAPPDLTEESGGPTGDGTSCIIQGMADGSLVEFQNGQIVRDYLGSRSTQPHLNTVGGQQVRDFALLASGCDRVIDIDSDGDFCSQLNDHRNLGADENCRAILNFEAERLTTITVAATNYAAAFKGITQLQLDDIRDLIGAERLPDSLRPNQPRILNARPGLTSVTGAVLLGFSLFGAYDYSVKALDEVTMRHLEADASNRLDAMSALYDEAKGKSDVRDLIIGQRDIANEAFSESLAGLRDLSQTDPEAYTAAVSEAYDESGIASLTETIDALGVEIENLHQKAIETADEFEERWRMFEFNCQVAECVEYEFDLNRSSMETFRQDLAFCQRRYGIPGESGVQPSVTPSGVADQAQGVQACSPEKFLEIIRRYDDRVELPDPTAVMLDPLSNQLSREELIQEEGSLASQVEASCRMNEMTCECQAAKRNYGVVLAEIYRDELAAATFQQRLRDLLATPVQTSPGNNDPLLTQAMDNCSIPLTSAEMFCATVSNFDTEAENSLSGTTPLTSFTARWKMGRCDDSFTLVAWTSSYRSCVDFHVRAGSFPGDGAILDDNALAYDFGQLMQSNAEILRSAEAIAKETALESLTIFDRFPSADIAGRDDECAFKQDTILNDLIGGVMTSSQR
jgi:hypothetical protein